MDEKAFLNLIKPFLNVQGNLYQKEYDRLFGNVPADTRIKVLRYMYECGIKIVQEQDSITWDRNSKDYQVDKKIKNENRVYRGKISLENIENHKKQKNINIEQKKEKYDIDTMIDKAKKIANVYGYLNKKDFIELFSSFEQSEQIKVLKLLKENNIDITLTDNQKTETYDKKKLCVERVKENYKVMTNLSNEQLCKLYQEGRTEALDVLIQKNEGLVYSRIERFTKRYKHKLDDDDLIQAGFMGMMKAAKKFDIQNGAKFSTYAMIWIEQGISRVIQDEGFTIRIPAHMFESINKVTRIMFNNLELNKEEIFEILSVDGLSREKFEEILRLQKEILNVSSINKMIGDGNDTELVEILPDEFESSVDDEVCMKILKIELKQRLETLTKREKEVIVLRYGFDNDIHKTLDEVGKKFGVTRERIRQIEAKAIKKLRHPSRSKGLKEFLRR